MVYLFTWDLNKEGAHYTQARNRLVERLKQYEHTYDSGLDSVWFLSTNWTADQVSADLRKYMDDNDKSIVTQLSKGTHQGWLTKAVWDWINARL
jgi:hypothetical protein